MATESLSVRVGARISEFRKKMSEVANTIRNTKTLAGNAKLGSLLALSPTLSPAIASASAGLAAMSASFAAAGTGAVAFSSVAVSALNEVFSASSELKKLNEKLKFAEGVEEQAKILEEMANIRSQLTGKQMEALTALQNFQSFWGRFAKQFEEPVLDVFIESLTILQQVIKDLKPTFEGSIGAVTTLMQSFQDSLKTPEVQKFFDFLNKSAGPSMVTFGKAFGNVLKGVMSIMTAFAPLSKDMEGGLVSLAEKFAAWAAQLSESKAFQQFIEYVQTNGPKLLSIIGQLGLLITNLLVAMAPMGAILLTIIQHVLTFTNYLLGLHPAVGIVMVSIFQLIGVVKLLAPVYMLLGEKTRKLIATKIKAWAKAAVGVAKSIAKMMLNMVKLGAKYTWMAAKAVANAAKVAATWTVTMVKAAAKGTATMIASIVKFVAKYAWMGVQALIHAAKVAASFVVAMGPVGWVIATVVALVALIIANWDTVKKWTVKIWNATVDFIVKAWNWIVDTTKNAASSVWNWIKDKFSAAKALSDKIHDAIWDKIHEIWNKIVNGIKDALEKIVKWVKDKFNDILSFWSGLGSSFYDAGKGLIDQMAKGIQNAAGKVISKVKNLAQKVRDFLPFSPAKTGPLSDLDKLDFGGPIADSITRATRGVKQSMGRMLTLPDISGVGVGSVGSNGELAFGGSGNSYGDIHITIQADELEKVPNVVRFFEDLPQTIKQYK